MRTVLDPFIIGYRVEFTDYDQVSDVIDGKRVLGPPQDIREVQNAYEALECKGSTHVFTITLLSVLIETYWNVKQYSNTAINITCPVLIETYWNVKYQDHINRVILALVLIETYWNVNFADFIVLSGFEIV